MCDNDDDGLTRWLQHLVGTTYFLRTIRQQLLWFNFFARTLADVLLCNCACACRFFFISIRSMAFINLWILVYIIYFCPVILFFVLFLFLGWFFPLVKNNILQTCEPQGAWKTTLVARIRTWISHLPYSFGVEQFITSWTWSCRA